jgi:hypothetical protein
MRVFMKTRPDSKFALNDLHQEIDFFDRKIAYCQQFEQFDSAEERESALRKLASKRGSLVKTALAMAERGVECDPKYLPRSFKQPPACAKGA